MIIRFVVFSLLVGAFAWLARAIVKRTHHLETAQLERVLIVAEDDGRRRVRRGGSA